MFIKSISHSRSGPCNNIRALGCFLNFHAFYYFFSVKRKKIIHAIAGFLLSTLILGVLFKTMHWPYANFLISWSLTIFLFGITPIYFIINYSTRINEDFTKEDRIKNILIGVFILALLSLWYAMIDLSKIPSPYSIP